MHHNTTRIVLLYVCGCSLGSQVGCWPTIYHTSQTCVRATPHLLVFKIELWHLHTCISIFISIRLKSHNFTIKSYLREMAFPDIGTCTKRAILCLYTLVCTTHFWQCQDSHMAECCYHSPGSKGNHKLAVRPRYDINVQWKLLRGAIHALPRYTNNYSYQLGGRLKSKSHTHT